VSTIITPTPGPGARLKRAREARELTLQEVADTLNLSAKTVSLLESEAWSALPRPAFTRGYLRTFARLVGEDPDRILDAYTAAVGGDADAVNLKRADLEGRGITEVIHKQPGTVLSGAVLAAALVTGIVLWAVWPDESARTRAVSPSLRPPASAPPASPGTAAASRSSARDAVQTARNEAAAAAPLPTEPAPSASQFPTSPVAPPVTDETASTATAFTHDIDPDNEEVSTIIEDVATTRVKRITAEGDDLLTFTFSGDCWVEVKNGEGENLYSDLGRSGDVLELVGEAPFRLRLGFAPGVELAFNHERVALAPHTRNNIASIVLGQ
jgi:cytoskeleton protein RodZ